MSEEINYKEFYEKNRVVILQYENLRENFSVMVDEILGTDYYNSAMDVYECDRISCADIIYKANRSLLSRIFSC